MGFLAYLLLGSLMGWATAHYFPGFSPRNKGTKRGKRTKATYLWSMFFGILGTAFAGYGGQAAGLFTAGQMLEWGSAIVGGFLLPQVYLLSIRA
ncbi:hypothetical protein PHIN8_01270 [Polynucleobacter sp. HIN8]|uniref:hypothetical protein n=1 Tax=Polynucleobacter sp. HIN8 TaxID=3047867 RepID=UPI002572962B|nr:hypothetical protein [Polynucleobacter sp. HIN8]BEI38183.1 hypothetical protein PHIN8_01270 [Polynucleobacter sp. HIN8]